MEKLLILGSASVHNKLIRAAKEMGVYTVVTDYLPTSEGKRLADESRTVDIFSLEQLQKLCREEGITAALSTHLDPCQRPYFALCDAMGFPCYGTADQFFNMTDKHAFKRMCVENGVDVIPEFSVSDVLEGRAEYPLFIKPVDSRGSRGQTLCQNKEEAIAAIEFAKRESSNGDILIEKFLSDAQEFQITYFFVNGHPYLIRTTDSYNGRKQDHLEKVVACSVSPSRYTEQFLSTAHPKIVRMFKRMGYMNGPIFVQGFYDHGVFRLFDPGLRFPGVDFDIVYKTEYNVDLMKMMVYYALNGRMPAGSLPEDMYRLNGKRAAVLFPVMKAGAIAGISGTEAVRSDTRVFSYLQRHENKEKVDWTYNVNQRFAEVDILAENTADLKNAIAYIQDTLSVLDENGSEMLFCRFDTDRIV